MSLPQKTLFIYCAKKAQRVFYMLHNELILSVFFGSKLPYFFKK